LIIIGHRFIPSQSIYHVANIDAINKTPPASTLYLEFDEENLETINHARDNNLSFALGVKSITQAVYASSLGASFILVDKELAHSVQKLANEYLYDAKVLVHIQKEEEIESFALSGIDGVIFSNAIIKISS